MLASHIRAADIYAIRKSSLVYEIVLTVYTDANRVTQNEALDESEAVLYFNNNFDADKDPAPVVVPRTLKEQIQNPSVFKNVFRYEYTVSSSNKFTVSYQGINRNANINNLGTTNNSDNYDIFIDLTVFHDAALINYTPQLLIPPLDNANKDVIYTHNPGGYDVDGDSLVYKLVEPRYIEGIMNNGQINSQPVPGYRDPADPSFGTPSSFIMDPVTGQITWDTPKREGEYNIAFIVEEYRRFPDGSTRLMSIINRDMQIFVENVDNNPPELNIPNDTCIYSGTGSNNGLEYIIEAWDEDIGQLVTISQEGLINETNATLTQIQRPRGDTSKSLFEWYPGCLSIRNEPYLVTFKAKDDHPSVPLATTKSFNVQILGAPPTNLTAQPTQGNIQLNWDNYNCTDALKRMEIYRINCDTSNVQREYCTGGIPEDWGFEKIGETDITETTFTDLTAKPGTQYCYIIAMNSLAQEGGKSAGSNIACAEISNNIPLITKVDAIHTPKNNGILVAWENIGDLDTSVFKGPFTVELFRSNDLSGSNFSNTPVFTYTGPETDTSFLDTSVDLENETYSYKIKFYNNGTLLNESASNSMVNLTFIPKGGRMELYWDVDAVWYQPDSLYQYIYIDTTSALNGSFHLVDSVSGSNYQSVIDGLSNQREYCFYIETRSVFCSNTTDTMVINKSNVICAQPEDLIPPCPPFIAADEYDCENFTPSPDGLYDILITWEDRTGPECEDDIDFYTVFWKPIIETDYTEIDQVDKTIQNRYLHQFRTSIAGCYRMTATDLEGNESIMSNEVCLDNCPSIEFPNIFTPNGDGKNDFFIPIPDPQFVQGIDFKVYSRWGNLVYNSTGATVYWDGKNNEGEQVTDGVYYYSAEVSYITLSNQDKRKVFSGWIQIVY